MISSIQKQVKIYNIDAFRLSNLLNLSINLKKDKRFSFTKDKESASLVLKDPFKNLVPCLNTNQYSNTIHNVIFLSNKKNFASIAPEISIPKTTIFSKYDSFDTNYLNLKNKFQDQRIITKPVADSVGRGIKLFDNIDNFITYTKKSINIPNTLVVQECLDPYLIKSSDEISNDSGNNYINRKFDMRLYVFVSSNRQFYISDNSFLRFSAFKYDLSQSNNNIRATVLTNTGINKLVCADTNKLILCTKNWDKFQHFKPTIETYCKTIFSNLYKHSFNQYVDLQNQNFVSILGIDVMITHDNKVKFIEINRRPDLTFLNLSQKKIKLNMGKEYLDFVYDEINQTNTSNLKVKKF
jgi:hypothetical protein